MKSHNLTNSNYILKSIGATDATTLKLEEKAKDNTTDWKVIEYFITAPSYKLTPEQLAEGHTILLDALINKNEAPAFIIKTLSNDFYVPIIDFLEDLADKVHKDPLTLSILFDKCLGPLVDSINNETTLNRFIKLAPNKERLIAEYNQRKELPQNNAISYSLSAYNCSI